MRALISLGAASLVALSASSALAFTSTGILERVTPSQHEVRLRDGDTYRLLADVDLSEFTAGQKVHVSWGNQTPSSLSDGGGERHIRVLDATSIRPAAN